MYRIIENVLNLCEFALQSNKLKEKIEDQTTEIFKHACKIIGYGNKYPRSVNHWAVELGNFLRVCNIKSKRNNKILPWNEIYKIMLSVYSDVKEFSYITGSLYSKYGYSDYKNSEIYEKIKHVLPDLIKYVCSLNDDDNINPDAILQIINNV